MSPYIALIISAIFIIWCLRFDLPKNRKTSPALWISIIWIFIIATRLPSQWIGAEVIGTSQALQEGNALDRVFYILLIVASISVLVSRSQNWKIIISLNGFLVALLSYSLLSTIWSDFTLVSIKRWIRDLGTYLVVLVTITDPNGFDAVRTVIRRFCIITIPLSILLNKYFPAMGRGFDPWTGQGFYIGATTTKNMLGVLCLISALFFLWDSLSLWSKRKEGITKWIIVLNIVFFIISFQLLYQSDSATSKVCLLIGCFILAASQSHWFKCNPSRLTVLIPIGITFYLFVEFGLGIDTVGFLAETVGRSSNLTGRTSIWDAAFSIGTNPFLGTGYESFWLGDRLFKMWERAGAGNINTVHNGYLEVYLSLGFIGLLLLVCFLIQGYRIISRRYIISNKLGSLGLALWAVLLFYNVTESAFKFHLLWVIYLFLAIRIPIRKESPLYYNRFQNLRSRLRIRRRPMNTRTVNGM